jgi:hypothetical protein
LIWSIPKFHVDDNNKITAKDLIEIIETLGSSAAWNGKDEILQLINALQGPAVTWA